MAALSTRRVDPFNLLVDHGIWAALGIAILTAAASAPRFLSAANIHDLMSAMAVLGIVSVGQTVVILSGGIDLSVGMLMGLVTVLTNGIMNGDPALAWPMVALGVAIGLAVGFTNGVAPGPDPHRSAHSYFRDAIDPHRRDLRLHRPNDRIGPRAISARSRKARSARFRSYFLSWSRWR